MVQLGICAFRQGMIKDAHNALLDIQSSGRAKELLGQGLLMRNMQERNAEQEKIEKRRQVCPFFFFVHVFKGDILHKIDFGTGLVQTFLSPEVSFDNLFDVV